MTVGGRSGRRSEGARSAGSRGGSGRAGAVGPGRRGGAVAAWLVAVALLALAAVAGLVLLGDGSGASVPDARLEVTEVLAGGDTSGFARATEPRAFRFPDDHGPHPAFRTEWWYLTGNLGADSGRRFGYQFTLFRVALAPRPPRSPSAWSTNQVYMAHFALTDPGTDRFRTAERFARGAVGLAGARAEPFRIWLEDWSLAALADSAFPARLAARSDSMAVDLRIEAGKPPVLQGREGLSVKGPGPGNASHYYSHTRMPTRGRVVSGADTLSVTGLSWMDREWSTSALGPGVVGWDWFAVQLDGGRELMYYRLRREDGTAAPRSTGSWVRPDGGARILAADEVRVDVRERWESPDGGARYPVSWRLSVPSEELELVLEPLMPDQEWRGTFRYWEGAVQARGTRAGRPVRGRGYVELTGYGGARPPGS